MTHSILRRLAVTIFASALSAPPISAAVEPADLVIENARIWSDGRAGFAAFAAVDDGAFVHVGERDESFIGPDTHRVDAQGRVVVPGLIDSHIHMLGGGLGLAQIQLRDATSKDDFINRVREWNTRLPEGRWLLGGRWSVESWDQPESPTREWVDPVTGDRPLFLSRMDGHSALANTAALRRAGITKDGPPDPVGGVIDRDPETGEPTGILRESAMSLVSQHIPPTSVDEKVEALHAAIDHALAHGITAVGDIPGVSDLEAYERLAASSDEPRLRFFLYPTTGRWDLATTLADRFAGRPGFVEVRGFKAYLDGSLGSRTAMMREPFLGNDPERPNWRGLFREGVENGAFERNVEAAAASGYQTITHAIGDKANHYLLNTLERKYEDLRAARCRSEHAQHLLPEDIQRFGDLGVIASMQPYHKADDGRYAEAYIGPDRARSSYAFKSLLDAGAVVAFGSDWPVVTLHPFLGVEAAVTGRTLAGDDWQTQENITVGEALRGYTTSGAYGVFAEDEIGRVAPGYRADFVILLESPFDAEPQWESIRPAAVYVDGRQVYDARR
ncbi:MAG: amidohydrolase [Phycisphaerales bacterium]